MLDQYILTLMNRVSSLSSECSMDISKEILGLVYIFSKLKCASLNEIFKIRENVFGVRSVRQRYFTKFSVYFS